MSIQESGIREGTSSVPQRLEVALLGHPILREVAKPIEYLGDPKLQRLIDDMIVTITHEKAVGLAAPQVFHSIRLIVIASRPTAAFPDAPVVEPFVMINPKIVSKSIGTAYGWEGCASVPGIRSEILRHLRLTVSFLDRHGGAQTMDLEGFLARVFQHENDHLDGIVFLDYPSRCLMMHSEFMKRVIHTPAIA